MKALLQQALDALEDDSFGRSDSVYYAKLALRTELAKPEPEPVASIYISPSGEREFDDWRVPLHAGSNLLFTKEQL